MAANQSDERAADSTAPPDTGDPTRLDGVFRWTLVALATLAMGAGLLGLLGVREAEASVNDGGYELSVRYAAVSRPGLATPFDVTVSRDQALPEQISIQVSSEYLAAFDENGLDPQPSESFSDGEIETWLFEIPPGEQRVTVSFDARLEPSVQWARTATVTLVIDGEAVTGVDIRTWVMP
jgi:hypothetical protein